MMRDGFRTKARLQIYWNYFKYIWVHKFWVGVELAKFRMFRAIITHDLSKFSPAEFSAYAIKFYGGDTCYMWQKVEDDYRVAWEHHKKYNKHHWQHWEGRPMPDRYVKEMIADWNAMGRVFGGNAFDYFVKNRHKMDLHPTTIAYIQHRLLG